MKKHVDNHQVAMVFQRLPHYRESIFRLLCQQEGKFEYTLFSDNISNVNPIKMIDPGKASLPVNKGGLRWRNLKNFRLGPFLWQRGVIKLALDKEFDTIIYSANFYFLSTWLSSILARINGKHTLMWTHGFLSDEKGLKKYIRKLFYKLADGILLYGNRAREIMIKKGFDADKLFVVYNSLDYDKQKHLRERFDNDQLNCLREKLFANPDLPILFFIGRLTVQKKLAMIIEAVDLLKKGGDNCNMLFIGSGPEQETITNIAEKLGLLDNIHFYGPAYIEEDIAPLIMMSDVCIAPGEVGLTAMHSLVYGVPVVTHGNYDEQMPEYEAIVDGYSGSFFRQGKVDDLVDKIKGWIKITEKDKVRKQCYDVIDKYYNPYYQLKVISAVVSGTPSHETQ